MEDRRPSKKSPVDAPERSMNPLEDLIERKKETTRPLDRTSAILDVQDMWQNEIVRKIADIVIIVLQGVPIQISCKIRL